MFLRRRLAVAATALSIATFALVAHAGGLVGISKGHAKIEGEAKPALGKFDGTLKDISAKEEGGKLIFTADLGKGLDMGLRQDHTKEAFHVAKQPLVKLVVDKSKVKFPEDQKSVEDSVTGDLTLNNVTKPVKVSYKIKRAGSDYMIKASFNFKYTEFGIEPIKRMGISVVDNVSVKVSELKLREK